MRRATGASDGRRVGGETQVLQDEAYELGLSDVAADAQASAAAVTP